MARKEQTQVLCKKGTSIVNQGPERQMMVSDVLGRWPTGDVKLSLLPVSPMVTFSAQASSPLASSSS